MVLRSEYPITSKLPREALSRPDSRLNGNHNDFHRHQPSHEVTNQSSASTRLIGSTNVEVTCKAPLKQFPENISSFEALRLNITYGSQDGTSSSKRPFVDIAMSQLSSKLDGLAGRLCSRSSSAEDLQHNADAWEIISHTLSSSSTTKSSSPPTQPLALTPSENSPQTEEVSKTHENVQLEQDAPSISVSTKSQPSCYLGAPYDLENSCKWLSYAFLACVLSSQGKAEAAEHVLHQTYNQFQRMTKLDDAQILVAQLILLGILHSHGQSALAGILLDQARKLILGAYDVADPIVTVTLWCHAIHGQSLSNTPIGSTELSNAHASLCASHGSSSPNALAALYALCFTQLSEGHLIDASRNLDHLGNTATSTLGPNHLITIGSLTARARALDCLGEVEAAIDLMLDAGGRYELLLGRNHPLRLDNRRRLASMYKKLVDKETDIEKIYSEVLNGRIQMLGPNHPYTSGSLLELVEFLNQRGKKDRAEEIERSFQHLRLDGHYSVEFLGSY